MAIDSRNWYSGIGNKKEKSVTNTFSNKNYKSGLSHFFYAQKSKQGAFPSMLENNLNPFAKLSVK